MNSLLDRIRLAKDFVSSVLAAAAAAGFPVIDDTTQASVWTAVFAVASLAVTLFAGGNTREAAHRR